MFKHENLMFWVTETSLHAGAGSDVGIVDLPIQREVHTTFPIIHGSSLKGALREYFRSNTPLAALDRANLETLRLDLEKQGHLDLLATLFGPDSDAADANGFASAIAVTDARLLFLPVQSLKGVFALVTCPLVLRRLVGDLRRVDAAAAGALESIVAHAKIAGDTAWVTSPDLVVNDAVVLRETVFRKAGKIEGWPGPLAGCFSEGDYRQTLLRDRVAVVGDDEFTYLARHATEIVPHIRIDRETGTAQSGALWYEENVPAESIFWNTVLFSDARDPGARVPAAGGDGPLSAKSLAGLFFRFLPPLFQLGGKETIGHGLLHPVPFSAGHGPAGE